MQRKQLVVACAVTGLVLCVGLVIAAFMTRGSVVSVRVIDKRLTIHDVRLFTAKNYYSYVPTFRQPQYQCQRVLDALGIPQPWKRYYALKVSGPALVVRGRLEEGDATELYLVREGQLDTNPYDTLPRLNARLNGFGSKGPFIWACPLRFPNGFGGAIVSVTNGVFHMRRGDETNDLAVIEIR